MKKLLVALALLTVSTVGYTVEIVSDSGKNGGIWIIDGTKVYKCWGNLYDSATNECFLVSSNYKKKSKNEGNK